VLRFSELQRAIPAISQKMLIQQLRQMEADGIVRRIVHHQVPPKVEYCLDEVGAGLVPVARRLADMGRPVRKNGLVLLMLLIDHVLSRPVAGGEGVREAPYEEPPKTGRPSIDEALARRKRRADA
jgi:hypothetical protein